MQMFCPLRHCQPSTRDEDTGPWFLGTFHHIHDAKTNPDTEALPETKYVQYDSLLSPKKGSIQADIDQTDCPGIEPGTPAHAGLGPYQQCFPTTYLGYTLPYPRLFISPGCCAVRSIGISLLKCVIPNIVPLHLSETDSEHLCVVWVFTELSALRTYVSA
jgi:hypothetical protein